MGVWVVWMVCEVRVRERRMTFSCDRVVEKREKRGKGQWGRRSGLRKMCMEG